MGCKRLRGGGQLAISGISVERYESGYEKGSSRSTATYSHKIGQGFAIALSGNMHCKAYMKVGHCRISTEELNPDLQLAALKRAGWDRVFTDKASSDTAKRKELTRCLTRKSCCDGRQQSGNFPFPVILW